MNKPAKKGGNQTERRDHMVKGRTIYAAEKKGLTLSSMATDLFLAVALKLLKNRAKSWSDELKATRKDLASEKECSVGQNSQPAIEASAHKVASEETPPPARRASKEVVWFLLKTTATQWINDKCPHLGAALAYFTVFS